MAEQLLDLFNQSAAGAVARSQFYAMMPTPAFTTVHLAGLWFDPTVQGIGSTTLTVSALNPLWSTLPRTFNEQRMFSEAIATQAQPEAIRANWHALSLAKISDKLTLRLYYLAQKSVNPASGLIPMRADSLASFLKFWDLVGDTAEEPDLVLTPKGNIQAEWYKNRTHFLEIDFRTPNKGSLFGLFAGQENAVEGADSVEEVAKIVETYRNGMALGWVG